MTKIPHTHVFWLQEMLPNISDLAIVSSNLGPFSSCKVGEDCGSYHLPIHVSINIGINKLPIKLSRPLKNIDWDEFKESLREKNLILQKNR